MEIRPERPGDEAAVAKLIEAAFANAEHRDGTEASIVEQLRTAGAMTVALVAEDEGRPVGHIAFSPVTIGGKEMGWFGLGPVAVLPDWQRRGIGSSMIEQGLDRLRALGAQGCVLVGEPAYYGRFGFAADDRLIFPGLPPEYFQALSFGGELPIGTVAYHPAFS